MLDIALLLAAILALGQTVASPSAAKLPSHVAKFVETCETARRGAIRQLEFDLRGLKSSDRGDAATWSRIAEVEATLLRLKEKRELVVPQLHYPQRVGDIGRLPKSKCYVEQILSNDSLLIRCEFEFLVRVVRDFRPRHQQVVVPQMLLVEGVPTEQLHAGTTTEMPQVFEIAARRRYRTIDGRIVDGHVLRPFDMAQVTQLLSGN